MNRPYGGGRGVGAIRESPLRAHRRGLDGFDGYAGEVGQDVEGAGEVFAAVVADAVLEAGHGSGDFEALAAPGAFGSELRVVFHSLQGLGYGNDDRLHDYAHSLML